MNVYGVHNIIKLHLVDSLYYQLDKMSLYITQKGRSLLNLSGNQIMTKRVQSGDEREQNNGLLQS